MILHRVAARQLISYTLSLSLSLSPSPTILYLSFGVATLENAPPIPRSTRLLSLSACAALRASPSRSSRSYLNLSHLLHLRRLRISILLSRDRVSRSLKTPSPRPPTIAASKLQSRRRPKLLTITRLTRLVRIRCLTRTLRITLIA